MEQKRAYITGITGSEPPEERRAATESAARHLIAEGYEVIEPTATEEGSEAQLKADIIRLISCSTIYLLTNWERSEKAVLEHDIAKGLKMRIEYETEPRHTEIKAAIKAAMGVPFRIIAQDSRNRWHVYARMIYAHHCKKAGENTKRIAAEISHDESSIGYYLRHYESEYKYNREFHKAAEKVATILSDKLKKAERQIINN